MDNRASERRSLRELSGRLLAVPARAAPAGRAIYRFARTADDIADEGDAHARRAPRRPGRATAPTSCAVAAGRTRVAALARASSRRLAAQLRAASPARAAAARPARRLRAGRAQAALRRPRRAARLLPPLGQPDRPPAAAPVRHRRRRRAARSPTPSARALQLDQLLAGPQRRLPRAAATTCRAPMRSATASMIDELLARRDSARVARAGRASSSPGRAS